MKIKMENEMERMLIDYRFFPAGIHVRCVQVRLRIRLALKQQGVIFKLHGSGFRAENLPNVNFSYLNPKSM